MLIVNPSVTLVSDNSPLLKIEKCCRAAYQSFDKIGEGSAERLLKMIMTKEPAHTSVIEHFRIKIRFKVYQEAKRLVEKNKYLELKLVNVKDAENIDVEQVWLYGNLRAFWDLIRTNPNDAYIKCIVGNALKSYVTVIYDYLDIPSKGETFADRIKFEILDIQEADDYYTFSIDTDRGVSHELVRHRVMSVTQESTRYCNYGKSDVTFMSPQPFPWAEPSTKYTSMNNYDKLMPIYNEWYIAMQNAEKSYLRMLELGATPQEARSVLPNSLKTNIVLSGTFEQWSGVLGLRCASGAHPQARLIAEAIKIQLIADNSTFVQSLFV